MFYQNLKQTFMDLANNQNLLDQEITIISRVLKPTEAIGNPDRQDFPLLKGKEVLMQATFNNCQGQAYTEAPYQFKGTLGQVCELDIEEPRNRSLFVSSLNAVMRHLNPELTTIHCKDNEPEECSQEIADFVREKIKPSNVGVIGLQPAILEAMGKLLGPQNVSCVDKDEENLGKEKYGVTIEWGDEKGAERMFSDHDVVLSTGSTLANGSIAGIMDLSEKHDTPVYFYGTTIAGAAQLMGLNRVCFRAK